MTNTTIPLRKITNKEFHALKEGDELFIKCGGHTVPCEVISAPFYNNDSDEPSWEVETTNGFSDEYSLYVKQ